MFCSIILIGLIPVYLLQSPVDVIYFSRFTSRLNSMHTIVLTIPHLNPTMLLPTPQSFLLYTSLVHVKHEVNVPLVFVCDESVVYVPEHNL